MSSSQHVVQQGPRQVLSIQGARTSLHDASGPPVGSGTSWRVSSVR